MAYMGPWVPAVPYIGTCTCSGGMHHPDECEAIKRAQKQK